ncbi:MAG: hypothetical protein DSY37_05040 [Hyperthermus sp.]|nr:MAG: hypothetical protein DSY37_05040 [Hyperthermus sp.]
MVKKIKCSLLPGMTRLRGGITEYVWQGGIGDREALLKMFSNLTLDTVLLRFLRPIKYWEPVVNELIANASLIILAGKGRGGGEEEVVASAEAYETGIRGVAELGIVVRDDLQGRGLGTTLTALTALCLHENNYKAMEAYFDPSNTPMRRIIVEKLGGRIIGSGRDMVFTRLDLHRNIERIKRVLAHNYTQYVA